jgi:hypothetical protein
MEKATIIGVDSRLQTGEQLGRIRGDGIVSAFDDQGGNCHRMVHAKRP